MARRLISRATLGLLLLATLYLAAVNTALNLPATRAFLNGLNPEQFQVSWQRAWSLYPLRLQLAGIAADGQTRTEQWQIDARRAAVSVSLLALLNGEIRVHHLDLVDIDLRLRPRPDTNQGNMVEFYPVIRNRDPKAPAEPLPEGAGGTVVLEIDDIHIRGEHAFWVSHIRGSLPGAIRGSFRIETDTGRLALAGGALDLALASLTIGPKTPVTDAGSIAGEIEIPPFTLSEPKGLQFVRLPRLDARLDLPVQSLDFLTLLMPPLGDKKLTGQGRLRGRVVLSDGEVLRGTDLVVETHALAMDLGRYHFSGDGSVEFLVDPADEAQADLIVRFDQVRAELEPNDPNSPGGRQELFFGRGLTAQLHAAETDPTTTSSAERFEELASEVTLKLVLTIPSMQVADLAVYTRLFPEQWDLALLGGTGTLSGGIEVTREQLSLSLDLASEKADLRYRDDHATADLRLQLKARVDQAAGPTLHLDGTVLRIEDAKLAVGDEARANGHQHQAKPWQAELRIADGALRLPVSAGNAAAGPIPAVAQRLQQQGFGALLASADGRLSAVLTVSELDWIATLLDRPLNLSLTGSGQLDTEIVLTNGQPDKGTTVTMPRQALSLALLRHQVDGQGTARLRMDHGGKHPRFHLALALDDARMRRRDESEPSIDGVRLDAEILVTDPLAGGRDAADVTLKLHSARVQDMSTYNAYLPPNALFSLVSGEANLVGDLHLKPHSARGQMLLECKDLRVALSDAELSGDLRVDLLIRDGSAQDMRFDITGSAATLDRFRVTGKTASAVAPDWHARLQLEETEVLWHKPMHLDMKAAVTVKDARPFVAMLDNARGEHGWIDNLLTVEGLGGHLRLAVDADSAVIEDALISSSEIGIHAKGRFAASAREAMLLARWHNLSGALELHNGQRHFDIGNAQARFAAYTPGKTPLPFLSPAHVGAEVAADAAESARGHVHAPAPAPHRKQPAVGHGSPAGRHPQDAPANPFLDDGL